MMKILKMVILVWGCLRTMTLQAQSLTDALVAAGMENVAVKMQENEVLVAVEDRMYGNSYVGLAAVLDVVRKQGLKQRVKVLVTDRNGIAQVVLELKDEELLQVHCSVDSVRQALKGTERVNCSAWKPDLVFYPNLFLENTSLDKLYRYAVGVAPAVECPLWQGAELTVQVIFPLLTNQQGQYRKIRPGVMTLSQELRLKNNWTMRAVAGNFTQNRFGLAATAGWVSRNGRWRLEGNLGATVFSMVIDKEWIVSREVRLDARLGASYYLPRAQTLLSLEGGRYVFGDYGVKASCERHFGPTTVGLFLGTSRRILNGGFCFSLPLPGKSWKRKRRIRVKPADYFTYQYSYNPPGQFTEEQLMYEYKTTADDERSKGWYQPDYLMHFLKQHRENSTTYIK